METIPTAPGVNFFAGWINRNVCTGMVLLILLISCQKGKVDPVQTFPSSTVWWNDHVFYELFVRSFYDSNGDGIGDFNGIIQKLDYLNDGNPATDSDLGVTAIWLMPVYPSPSYHGYDVTDFRTVNPQYGTLDDFKKLVSECHKRGIKLILDFEVTATSDQHPWFADAATSPSSAKRNWYVWSATNPGYTGPWGQNVWYPKNDAYYYGTFSSAMPHLNYTNGQLSTEIRDILRYWHQDIGVDGFRMDAASLLIEEGANQANTQSTLNWWRDYFIFQKRLDPSIMTVGEVWDATPIIQPYADHRMDYCFEFDLANAIIDAVQNGNVSRLSTKMTEVMDAYPALQYGTFLTNHDQNRIIEDVGLDVAKAKAAAGILLSLPGIPYVYYGEEVAMRGQKPDEDIRKPMQWNNGLGAGFTTFVPWRGINSNYTTYNVTTLQADTNSIWHHYRRLIHARTGNIPLKQGSYEPVFSGSGQVFSFLRVKGNEAVLAYHNLQGFAIPGIQLSAAGTSMSSGNYSVTDLLSGANFGSLAVGANGSFIFSSAETVEAYSTHLIRLQKQ